MEYFVVFISCSFNGPFFPGTYKVQAYDYTKKDYLPSAPGVGMLVEVKDPEGEIVLSRVSYSPRRKLFWFLWPILSNQKWRWTGLLLKCDWPINIQHLILHIYWVLQLISIFFTHDPILLAQTYISHVFLHLIVLVDVSHLFTDLKIDPFNTAPITLSKVWIMLFNSQCVWV